MMDRRKRWLLGAAAVLIGASMSLAIACSDDENSDDNGGDATATEARSETPGATMGHDETPGETEAANEVHVALEEYAMSNEMGGNLPTPHAGTVAFEAHNEGTLEHSFLIVKTELAEDQLPLDGTVVDESAIDIVGQIDSIPAGEADTVSADLEAGTYVLICNIAGHYTQGMHASLTVM